MVFAVNIITQTHDEWIGSDTFDLVSEERKGSSNQSLYRLERGDMLLDITISSTAAGVETISSLSARFNGTSMLKAVKYPIQTIRTATFDELLISSAWGDCIQQPAKTIRDVSTSTSIRFGQDYIRYAPNEVIYTYPAIMAMQYMVLFNQARSQYFATYSASDETMTFHAKSISKYEIELSVNHYPFMRDGLWTSPDCAQANLGGGWHEAAKLYRKHMAKVFPAPDYPAWMREDYHGWTEISMKKENYPPKFSFADIPAVYKRCRDQTGMEHLFLVGWHDDGHDTKFPRYLPCAQAGEAEDLRDALLQVKRMGGRCSLYTNARLIDIGEEFYQQGGGKNAVCIDENGNEYHECYGTSSVYAVSCPGCDAYVGQMASVTRKIYGDYAADGMFVDQISCNLDPFCFAKTHEHTKPSNNALLGIEKELRAIRHAHQKLNGDFHTFAEGYHERFSSIYDVNQGHGEEYTWQIGKSMPEQFIYTFPDRIVTGHCADKQQMYHAMAQFKPLDLKDGCYDDESNWDLLKTYIKLRKAYKEYFLRGEFIDDEGFDCDSGTKVFAVRAADDSICFCAWKKGALEETVCSSFVRLPDGYQVKEMLNGGDTSKHSDQWLKLTWTGALCYVSAVKKQPSSY